MGTFVFKWEHPASEVYVTGTFDDWSKSEKLVKTGDVFQKNVTLSSKSAEEKIYYKFVVDGNWVTDHTAPQENDAAGNLNNVLTTDRIIKHKPETAGIMSGVAPTSTTAALAKDVPLESEKAPLAHTGSSDLPGAFPETPAALEKDDQFSVNPLPASDNIKLAPGEKVPEPSTITANTLTSGVHDDPELVAADKAKGESEQTVGVSPLPAFAGAVNPIKVQPGEKLPEVSTLTGNTTTSAVRTDKESYENSAALAPVLPPVVTPQAERDQKGTGILDLPPITKSLIPESSLPMGTAGVGSHDATPTIQSAGPQSTTATLAAGVPLESTKVPKVVKESQQEAGFAPEASAVPEEVKEKSAVEKELLSEVPVAPTTSEGTAGKGTDKSEKGVTGGEAAAAVGGAAAAVGAAVGAAFANGASVVGGKLPTSVSSKLPESVQKSINTSNTDSTPKTTAAKGTPEVVKESIVESGQSPEAAGNQEAVLEKKAVEKELLSEVKPETSTGESAPKIGEGASKTPETAATLATPTTPAKSESRDISRDVSPRTVPGSHGQSKPEATTGVASTMTEPKTSAAPSTPSKSKDAAPASTAVTPSNSKDVDSPAATSTTDKKNKRRSFFGRIKDKLKN